MLRRLICVLHVMITPASRRFTTIMPASDVSGGFVSLPHPAVTAAVARRIAARVIGAGPPHARAGIAPAPSATTPPQNGHATSVVRM